MTRVEALARLEGCASAVKARGGTSLYLFGSVARDEGKPGSDLDVFIEYDPGAAFSLIDLVSIQQMLEDAIGVSVDLTTRNSLHPLLRDGIEASAVRVF